MDPGGNYSPYKPYTAFEVHNKIWTITDITFSPLVKNDRLPAHWVYIYLFLSVGSVGGRQSRCGPAAFVLQTVLRKVITECRARRSTRCNHSRTIST
jgi:hypothetical protein